MLIKYLFYTVFFFVFPTNLMKTIVTQITVVLFFNLHFIKSYECNSYLNLTKTANLPTFKLN